MFRTVVEISIFIDFQNSERPPSWIFNYATFKLALLFSGTFDHAKFCRGTFCVD